MNPTPREGNDYRLVPDPEDDDIECVEITSGPYEGIVVRYGNVKFEEQKGEPVATFQFEFVQAPHSVDVEALRDDRHFNHLLGCMMLSIMEKMFEDKEVNDRSFKAGNVNSEVPSGGRRIQP